jgi:serpin B
MKLRIAILIAILSCTASLAPLSAFPVAEPEKRPISRAVVDGNAAFAVDLYHRLRSSGGNLFFSPHSISTALSMTLAGARGNTAKEMAAALHFRLDQGRLHQAFRDLNRTLAANARKGGQKLNIANGLCLTGGGVSEEYKALLKGYYDAEIFAGKVDRINGWVRKKTENKIDRILENLSANSVFVLLNAIYFKGTWESQFEKEYTRNSPFKVSPKRQVTVPLMYQKRRFKLLEKKDLQIVSIPYKGGQMSMIVLLPRDMNGLSGIEKKLSSESLKKWVAELDKQSARETHLHLPKIRLETSYDLVPACKSLGMKDALKAGSADFRGMGWPKGDLWIAQIKHKAYLEVNEEGTEAAAATAVEAVTRSVVPDPVFRADHPFLFVIRDDKFGSVLFVGRMVDPGGQ